MLDPPDEPEDATARFGLNWVDTEQRLAVEVIDLNTRTVLEPLHDLETIFKLVPGPCALAKASINRQFDLFLELYAEPCSAVDQCVLVHRHSIQLEAFKSSRIATASDGTVTLIKDRDKLSILKLLLGQAPDQFGVAGAGTTCPVGLARRGRWATLTCDPVRP